MKALRLIRGASVFACAAALSLCLAACGSSSSNENGAAPDVSDVSGGVAATVNGTEIGENAVSAYIANFRSLNSLTEDTDWAQWMVDNGYTASSLREEVVNYFASQELVRQAAEENGVKADDEAIEEQLNTMKLNYDTDGDGKLSGDEESSWTQALQTVGISSEDEYRSLLEMYSIESKLQEAVATVSEPSQEDLLQYAQMYATAYDGAKKSSHILFAADDEATAQEVLDKINSGELDFAEAAKQYSTDTVSAADGGNVGWDAMNSFVSEYSNALAGLEEGQVSGLVTSEYGIHIIKCTEAFTAPEEVISSDQIPAEFLDSIKASLEQSSKSTSYQEWFQSFYDSAEIVVNDMPEGLPYDVDLTGYTPSPGSMAAATSLPSGDASAEAGASAEAEAPAEGDAAAGESSSDASADAAVGQPAELSTK